MFNLSVQIKGAEEILSILDSTVEKVEDLSPAFREISQSFYGIMSNQFAIGGLTPWEPLSERYAAWKARVAPGKPIMELTGKMKESLTSGNASGSILNITPRMMKIGTSARSKKGYRYPYAHQYGLGHNKERKVIELPEGTAGLWVGMINNFVLRDIAGASDNWDSSIMSDYGFEEGF